MVFTSVVSGSALAEAVLLALVLAAVIWVVSIAATGVLVVVSAAIGVPVGSAAVPSEVGVVDLLGDAAAEVFFGDDLAAAPPAAVDGEVALLDFGVDFGPRAVCPVGFFADPEFDVAELVEPDAELWSVSSALATATTGPASDNPSTNAAIPALAPR